MKKPKRLSSSIVWYILAALVVLLYIFGRNNSGPLCSYAKFRQDVEQGDVANVRVDGNTILVKLASGEDYHVNGAIDPKSAARLYEDGVVLTSGKPDDRWTPIIWVAVVTVVFVVIFRWLRSRSKGGLGGALGYGKSLVRPISDATKVTLSDVGGCVEAKELLQDVVDYLKNPARWEQAKARPPRGILLEGPPGCGKTLLARALAGETNSQFYLSPASEFVEMFVGIGAARVRDTFDTASKNGPAIIFIDEIDAVGRRRGSGIGAGHDEREQTLNQLLLCLDGVERSVPLVVIAATNRPDVLDPALLRPGRFDRRIHISVLSREARVETLRIHTKDKPLASSVSLETVADKTEGFCGAQIECLANEAALLALRRVRNADGEKVEIRMEDFENSLGRMTSQAKKFNKVDQLMIESTSQLAEPTGKAVVRVAMDGESIEGHLVWADAHFVKVSNDDRQAIIAKAQIKRIEALDGTEVADPTEVKPDPWAGRNPGLA